MYPTGEKVYADEMSSKDVSYKAKVIAAEDAAEEAVVD